MMDATVVLVEDEELISTMVRLNLEQEGLSVHSFDTAEGAIEHVTDPSQRVDLILLDIMLPGMNGDEALTQMRARGVDAPVMMLTAKSDVDTRVETLNRGADDYLAKPFDVRELVARVQALLRRSQGGSQSN